MMKSRKIAPKSAVIEILKHVLSRKLKVESQDELARIVLRELRKRNNDYGLAPLRLRRIALSVPEIAVRAKTKKFMGLKVIEKCPVCESGIKPFKVKNLMNKEITVGYECVSCGYQSDLEAFMPMKYIFVWKTKTPE